MLNIVVPMAGRGSRFANAGYKDPKPLIRFGGKPMIQWVVENVTPKVSHRLIFLCLEEHLRQYPDISSTLRAISPRCEIVPVGGVTEGAACTVLLARTFIDTDEPLMIANSDQFVSLDINDYLAVMDEKHADGLIMTFEADDAKWSYCRLREDGTVSEVVEKREVSNEATVGIYNFHRGRDFVRAADKMIAYNLRVNNEFYVAPTYNQLIAENAKIFVSRTGREYSGMYGLGIPTDLDFFMTTSAYDQGQSSGALPLSEHDRIACLSRHVAASILSGNRKGLSAVMASHIGLRLSGEFYEMTRENLIRVLETTLKKLLGANYTSSVEILGTQQSKIDFLGGDDKVQGVRHLTLRWEDGVVFEIEVIISY